MEGDVHGQKLSTYSCPVEFSWLQNGMGKKTTLPPPKTVVILLHLDSCNYGV